MTWSFTLSLILIASPAIFADSSLYLFRMETAIGQKVENAAREAKFEAELVGLVVEKEFACEHVVYDMADWLSGKSFRNIVDDFLRGKEAPQHMSRYNMKEAYQAALEHHKIEMKHAYEEMTSRLIEWNKETIVIFAAGIRISPPDILRGFKTFTTQGVVEVNQEAFQMIELKRFEDDLRHLSNGLIEAFRKILHAMKSGKLSSELFNEDGGDFLFKTLASKILDGEYNGSFVEEFGMRLADMQKITVLGYKEGRIVTEVCITKGTLKNAHALFKIVPHGSLRNTTYTKPSIPSYYAATKSFEKLDDLLVVRELSFFQDGRAIAKDFDYQSNRCRLSNTTSCYEKEQNMTAHRGTILNRLGKSTLIVTTEKTGKCIDANGHILKYIRLKSPIFRHKHADCLLQIGDKRIGNKTVDVHFIPKDFEGFLPNEGDFKGFLPIEGNKKHGDPVIDPFAAWILDPTFIIGGLGGVVLVLGIVVGIIVFKYLKYRSDLAKERRRLAAAAEIGI